MSPFAEPQKAIGPNAGVSSIGVEAYSWGTVARDLYCPLTQSFA